MSAPLWRGERSRSSRIRWHGIIVRARRVDQALAASDDKGAHLGVARERLAERLLILQKALIEHGGIGGGQQQRQPLGGGNAGVALLLARVCLGKRDQRQETARQPLRWKLRKRLL